MNPPAEIAIDVSDFADEKRLHEYLAKIFDFPNYYGGNWDAFFDCIMYDSELKMPLVLRVRGITDLRRRLPISAEKFVKCLNDYVAEFTERQVVFEP